MKKLIVLLAVLAFASYAMAVTYSDNCTVTLNIDQYGFVIIPATDIVVHSTGNPEVEYLSADYLVQFGANFNYNMTTVWTWTPPASINGHELIQYPNTGSPNPPGAEWAGHLQVGITPGLTTPAGTLACGTITVTLTSVP